ncbi:hypothetical protein CC78DRAFT_534264 [Lojkania enalia]|uniref:Uncharacterized protein n=1 Tax=Lojkania enalia TaxID=147567 RepID=A0A9P4N5B2_9PLEO|nr:hypothetical protein CC78DRAFT_534264 [Didymosphaeria enalia]
MRPVSQHIVPKTPSRVHHNLFGNAPAFIPTNHTHSPPRPKKKLSPTTAQSPLSPIRKTLRRRAMEEF